MTVTARLDDDPLRRDPIAWIRHLLDEAAEAEGGRPDRDPMRFALATADARGRPAVRYLLLKGFGPEGFVFYTNYESRKAGQLEANPWGAVAFHWWSTGVQIRGTGPIEKVSAEESDAYFAGRPRESQLGAWASPQSRAIPGRATLEKRLAEVTERFEGRPVERPPCWGGYRLRPETLEVWVNGEHRLHDRFQFTRIEGGWTAQRLAP